MSAASRKVEEWPPSIFRHWGEETLQNHGALELPDARPASLTNAIHPLFSASKWTVSDSDDYESPPPSGDFDTRLNAEDYRLLKPSLRLGSQFLADPSLLPYWHALLFGPRIPLPAKEIKNGGRRYKAGYSSFTRTYNLYNDSYAISTAEVLDTHNALRALADMTSLKLGPSEEADVWATTRRIFTKPVPAPFPGTGSSITLNIRLLRSLRSAHLTASARLRVQYFLGIALVHELAHAAHNGHTAMRGRPKPDGSYAHSQWVHEAFFEHDSLAEAGHAWEQSVLNGTQIPFHMHPECPFGLQFEKWPGVQAVPPGIPTRRKRKRWTTVYALPMRFVQAAMTDRHWVEVERFGAEAVRAPKELGWRLWLRRRSAVVDDEDEGVSWDDSSRGRSADGDGVVWPVEEDEDVDGDVDAEDGMGPWDPMEID